MEGPGLGVELLPAVFERSDLTVRRTPTPEVIMSIQLFSLKGRTALVTGSSRGLGRAMAQGLADAGAAIVLNGANAERLRHGGRAR